MNLPTTISRAAMAQALRDLTGIDPDVIHTVHMTPSAVTVDYYVTDQDGQQITDAGGEATVSNQVVIEVMP